MFHVPDQRAWSSGQQAVRPRLTSPAPSKVRLPSQLSFALVHSVPEQSSTRLFPHAWRQPGCPVPGLHRREWRLRKIHRGHFHTAPSFHHASPRRLDTTFRQGGVFASENAIPHEKSRSGSMIIAPAPAPRRWTRLRTAHMPISHPSPLQHQVRVSPQLNLPVQPD